MHTTHNPNRDPRDIQREQLSAQLSNDAWKAARNKLIAPRSYTNLYMPLAIIALIFILLTSLYSGATEYAYFYSFGDNTNLFNSIFTGAFALVATVVIEVAKTYLLYLAFYKLFKEKTLAYFPLLSALVCSLISVYFSYKGAAKVAPIITQKLVPHKPQLINLDSIAQGYNAQIAKNEAAIELVRTQNTRTTGEIRSTGQKNINDIVEQNKLLLANREKAIQSAQQTNTDSLNAAVTINQKAATAHQQHAAEIIESASLLSIVAELVMWFCSAFIWHYYVQSWYEDGAPDLSPSPTSPTPYNGNKYHSNEYEHTQTIQPVGSNSVLPHSPPQSSWPQPHSIENYHKNVEKSNFDTNFQADVEPQHNADTNIEKQPENTEKNTVIHSTHSTEIQTKNNTAHTVQNTALNSQIDAKNTDTSGVENGKKYPTKLVVTHFAKEEEKTTQIELFEKPKTDNSHIIWEINSLKQRHEIEHVEIDSKGKLIVSYLFPDEYDKTGFIRKKTTSSIKTHLNTYLKRAQEAEKESVATANRERAAVLSDVIRYCDLTMSLGKGGKQEIG